MGSSKSHIARSDSNLDSWVKTTIIDKHSLAKQYETDCYVCQRVERNHHIAIQNVNGSVNIFERKRKKKKRIQQFLKKFYCIKEHACGHKSSHNDVPEIDKYPEQESTNKLVDDYDNLSSESGFVDGNDSVRTEADGSDEMYYCTLDPNVNNYRNRNGIHRNNFVSFICHPRSINKKLLPNLKSSQKLTKSLSSIETRDSNTFEDDTSNILNISISSLRRASYHNTQCKQTVSNDWKINEDFHGLIGLETQAGYPSTIGDDIANTLVDINSSSEESTACVSQNIKSCEEKVINVHTGKNVYCNNIHGNDICHYSEINLAENKVFNEYANTSDIVLCSIDSNDVSSRGNERYHCFYSIHERPDREREQQNKQYHLEQSVLQQEISEASVIGTECNITPITLSNSNNVGNKDLTFANWQSADKSIGISCRFNLVKKDHADFTECKQRKMLTRIKRHEFASSCIDNDNKRTANGSECKNQQKTSWLDSDIELSTAKNKLPLSILDRRRKQYKETKKFIKLKQQENQHLNSATRKKLSMKNIPLTSKSVNNMINEAQSLTGPEYSSSSYSSNRYQSSKHLSKIRRKCHKSLGVKLRHRNKTYIHGNQHSLSYLERQDFIRSLVQEIHPYIATFDDLVLSRYFAKVEEGQRPTTEEQMTFEWLRLASFSNYQGNGNALALARNGFYHDSSRGPHATRCIHCGIIHSTWELFDNVIVEHRRMSPRCPMLSNSSAQSNVPIDVTCTQTTTGNDGTAQTSTAATSVSATTTAAWNNRISVDNLSNNLQNTSISQTQQTPSYNNERSQQPTDELEYAERQTFVPPTCNIPTFTSTSMPYMKSKATEENIMANGTTTNAYATASTPSNVMNQTPVIAASSIGTAASPVVDDGIFAMQTGHSQMPSKSNIALSSDNQTSGSNLTFNPAGLVLGPENRRSALTADVVVTNPKYPDYRTLESRTNSYRTWPAYLDQTPIQMAEAGFFFVCDTDSATCFACGGGLRNWEPGDDPVLEHTRWFPRCEYINKLKGERYVQAVARRHKEHMAERQRRQIGLASTGAALQTPPDALKTRAGVVLREMGYTVEKIREAINAVIQQTGVSDVTAEQALSWILDVQERQSEVSRQLPATNDNSLLQENERLREMQRCKICMESSVDTTLMPCGHLVCCEPCAKRLRKCPICRKIINGTVKTFMS